MQNPASSPDPLAPAAAAGTSAAETLHRIAADAGDSGPRFCANLKWLFTEVPFEERFASAAAAGFTAVEYASPYQFTGQRLAGLLAAEGLKQVLINTPTGDPGSVTRSGAGCQPQHVRQFRNGFERALDYAADLDCGLIHVMAGIRPAGITVETAAETFRSNLTWAAGRAATGGVGIVVEAINRRDSPDYFLSTQQLACDLVAGLGVDNAGVLFDVYHCQVQEGDVSRRLQASLPLVKHVQVADPPDRSEPGTGELNWVFLLDQLTASGYQGWVGCEYRPGRDTWSGLSWISELTGQRVDRTSRPAAR